MAVDQDGLQSAQVLREIAFERERQVHGEGYTRAHDDRYKPGELACAGAAYAWFATLGDQVRGLMFTESGAGTLTRVIFARLWPWPLGVFKPKDERRRELVVGAALIVAEIERMDRAARVQVRTPPGPSL